MKPSFPAREVLWFLFWLVALSGPVSAFIVHLGTQPPMMSRMLMWCPGAAALLTCLICRINVKSLGWKWPSSRFMAWGYFLPWLYAIPVYVIVWLLIPGSFEWGQYSAPLADQFKITAHPTTFAALFGIPTTMTLIVVGTFAWALGEEIGWRGFLVPRLYERLGLVGTSVASGLLWAVWHYPSLLGSDYNAGTPALYAVSCFTVLVVAMSFMMTWLRMASGSLWPCVMMHAAHNTLIQAVLDEMTARNGRAPYFTTEFGAATATLATIVAAVLLIKARHTRPHVPAPTATALT